ncbi:CCR4-NOT core subunit cdc39, variant 2 [Umbelopsis sp. WA50703]
MTQLSEAASANSRLSSLLLEAGYDCCSSVSSLENLIQQAGDIKETDVAQALGLMARTHTNLNGVGDGTEGNTWNVRNFANAIKKTHQSMNWKTVIQSLDYEHFLLYDATGLEMLVQAWQEATGANEPFPLECFFGKWKNLKGQLSALYQIVNAPQDLVNVNECATKKIITMEDIANSNANIRNSASQLATSQFNSYELIESVIGFVDTEVHEDAKVFLDFLINRSPELVFLGLVEIEPLRNSLHEDLIARFLIVFLSGHANSLLVMTKLWQIAPDLLMTSFIEFYNKDATSISRTLDIAQELKILPQILNAKPFGFAIDLAALASRREYLKLEKWLQDKIAEHEDAFISACLDFLTHKIASDVSRRDKSVPSTVPLSIECMGTFLKVLGDSSMSTENAEMLKEVQSICLQAYPKLMNIRSQAEPGSTGGEVSFSTDVEDEANLYYERIYSGEMTIEQMIDLLKKFKNSSEAREQDIFACMIHNLFDEFHFFSKYPDKELAITSVLFGSLIQHHLVSYVPLGIALRYVLDALRNPPGSKLFRFGLQSLTQFLSRLPEWPQYCTHILQISQLQQTHPEIIRKVNAALQASTSKSSDPSISAETLSHSLTDVVHEEEGKGKDQKPAFSSLNVQTLISASDENQHEAPSEATQDKVLFIINNVAPNNLESKTNELKEVLSESAYRWFSNYLVVKRASIEPNYHQLYLQLLEGIDSKVLYEYVLKETYANIKILLNSEKTVQSSSERTLLKNLGSWLGAMTIARNRPIKHKHIAFKELLLEGYDTHRLIVVIPFVCKVLEQGSKTNVFKPPNPWVMAILKLLVELYQFADLKLNLKFEIEVLCKSLNIELNDISPTSLLKSRPKGFGNALSMGDGLVPGLEDGFDVLARGSAAGGLNQGMNADTGLMNSQEDLSVVLPNLAPYITFNPQVVLYTSQPASKRWVLQALTAAVREIIGPVVDRSVAIAVISTRELIAKDFAMESDENKMRKAAHLMVQNLASNLAMVTCKEPLRISMTSNLRSIFVANGFTDAISEQAILLTVADNLDLVCTIIEKAAMEKAVSEIDEALLGAYALRVKHREQRINQPYFDVNVLSASHYPLTLPEPLRLKPNGLQQPQMRVYEDFGHINRAISNHIASAESERGTRNVRPETAPGYAYGNAAASTATQAGGFDNAQVSAHQILEKFAQFVTELDKQTSQTNISTFNALPPNHDIRLLVRQIPILALSSFDKVEAALTFAQKVVQLLYKCDTNLARETYVVLLERLCETSVSVAKEVTSWLTHADDERKYNVPVTTALIKAGLIILPEQDLELAKLIDSGRPTVIDFTARLMRACVFEDPPCATRQDFSASLEALGRLIQRGKVPDSVVLLQEEIRRRSQGGPKEAEDEEAGGLREQLQFLFAEWVRLFQHPSSNEKAFTAFITQLSQQGVFNVEDISSMFFRICTETSIDHAVKFKALSEQATPAAAYQPIDAFAKLVVLILKMQVENAKGEADSAPVDQFTRVLSIIVLVLAQHHEHRRQQFNQKPFLRIFSSFLSEISQNEQALQSIHFQLLEALGNTFFALQPFYFPGFTFAWLQLISHRQFMPKLFLVENQTGWPIFQRLLISLFKFLVPFLRNVELQDTTRLLYRGTLRVLLVLLHDFPEFLCEYHFSFCDVIPTSCIQLRNLILSAFPRNMRLPDPFTPNLKVDLLPEINQQPKVLSDYTSALVPNNLKQDIDAYLQDEEPPNFLADLPRKLTTDAQDYDNDSNDTKYDISVINSLVFYVGIRAIELGLPMTQGAPIKIFQHLLVELDSEGRYLFLSAIANQLRFPNSHTHYFSCILLYLFSEGNQEIVKEQVTRVLLERLIVNRPHPWGLLITFIELIKNPRYNFWNHAFTRCAADIERLFESVSRSINHI